MKKILSTYLSDDATESIFSDEAFIQKMKAFEIELAKSEAKSGIVTNDVAEEIEQVLNSIEIPAEELVDGTLADGIPTIALLKLLRSQLSENTKSYLHLGATSQDVMDTAMVLVVKDAIQIFEQRLNQLVFSLRNLAEEHFETYCVSRTRTQQATPTTYALRIANWTMPLIRQIDQLSILKEQLFVVQFGGANGNLSYFGEKGIAVGKELASSLGLNYSLPWHAQRDPFANYTAWISITSGLIAKIAQDVLQLSYTEIGEITEAMAGGQSSAMPHKNNPVLSEAVIALANSNNHLCGIQFQSLQTRNERDGIALASEWMNISQVSSNFGAITKHILSILGTLKIHEEKALENIEITKGLVYAEKAVHVLSSLVSPLEAKVIVAEACKQTRQGKKHISWILNDMTSHHNIDWVNTLKPENCLGSTSEILAEFFRKFDQKK